MYGQHYISRQHKPLRRLAEDAPLPASLGWAALRGEGVVRLRFCHCFESLGFTWTESDKLLGLWEKIGCHRGLIFDLLAQAGIFAALSSQCRIAQPTPELAWNLYCGLVDSLEREEQTALLTRLTNDLWLHHYRRMFPDAPVGEKPPSLITLRQRAHKALQKHYKLPVELKESFTTDSGMAGFSLRYRLVSSHAKAPWIHLPEFHAARLKPLKLTVYDALLDALKPGQAGEHSERPGAHLDGSLLSYSGMVILFARLFQTASR